MVQPFGNIDLPDSLSKESLDDLLMCGWFRMGQTVFTSHFLNFNQQFYPALWLRVDLNQFQVESKFKAAKKRNDFRFEVVIRDFEYTEEKEQLYQIYKDSVTFEPSNFLHQLLYGVNNVESKNIFHTKEIAVYDDGKLVGVGVFDIASRAAAGIVSFYHPDYKQFSLGKYMIYKKLEMVKELGLDYFYPGYFADDYPAFLYKLSIGKKALEFFDVASQMWLSLKEYHSGFNYYKTMNEKLMLLSDYFEIPHRLVFYEYYNANIIPELKGFGLFDFPIFVQLFPNTEGQKFEILIVWDPRIKQYALISCTKVANIDEFELKENYYQKHLLKLSNVHLVSNHMTAVVEFLLKELYSEKDTQA